MRGRHFELDAAVYSTGNIFSRLDMKNTITTSSRGLLILVASLLAACSDIDQNRGVNNPSLNGQTLVAQVCSNCHGLTGESVSPEFPKLNGQQRAYLVSQLTDFKGHLRSDAQGTAYMWGFTNLTPEQIDQLADYFSAQLPMRRPAASTLSLNRGELIFKSGLPDLGVAPCSACHGALGEGNAALPRLAGQHTSYIAAQILVFQHSDARPRGEAMKQVTHLLSQDDSTAVARYIASLGASQQ